MASPIAKLTVGSAWWLAPPVVFALLFTAVSMARASEAELFAEATALLRQAETSDIGARRHILEQARERLQRIVNEYPNSVMSRQLQGQGIPVLGGGAVSLSEVSRSVEQAGNGIALPGMRPEERSQSVLNTLERLRQQQQQQQPLNPGGPPQQGGAREASNAGLTASERSALADQLAECWSPSSSMVGLDVVVELRIHIDGQGTVRHVAPNGSMASNPRARAVYESLRDALMSERCNPLRIPAAKYQALSNTVFRISPRYLAR